AGLMQLPRAMTVVLADYPGHTWADIAAERGDAILAAMRDFLARHDTLAAVALPEAEGDIAGITYRVRGKGPPLILLPLDLSRREGLLDHIDFAEGRAETLPLPDGAVDVALSSTVFEEGDADRMLSEIVRVTKPGGRIGITVRAVDMPFWVNLPLEPALKAK